MSLTAFDISIIFTKIGEMAGQPVMVEQATVTVSPQHFKALLRSMEQTLTAFENVFGKLQIPDADTQSTTSAAQIQEQILQAKKRAKPPVAAPTEESPPPASTQARRTTKRARGSAKH
jgi:hypothetical protein